jgi:hypothetical protein
MEADKFMLSDYLAMSDLIHQLREITAPRNEHIDPISIDLMWCELYTQLLKMGNHFKDQLINKEYIEKYLGKKVQSFEKVYNENGVLTGVNVVPVMVAEYITINFTITPTGDAKNIQ